MQTKVIEKPKNKARVGGNILSKTGLGAYTYGSAHPHAVTGVENTGYVIQSAAQHIDYNPWGKASRIEEGQYSQTLRYGPDRQRWVVTYSMGGRFTTMDPLCEKYYGVSPYAYCGNNPVNKIDPDGQIVDDIYYNEDGNELYRVKKDGPDNYYVIKTTKKTNEIYTESASPKQKGWSNPISKEDAFTTELKIMNGDITGKHMENVTYLGNSNQINGMLNSIKDDGKGGTSPNNNREYSGNLNSDGVKDIKQGSVGDPSKGQHLKSLGNPDYHSHPSGTKPTNKIGYSHAWQQGPSPQDIKTANGNEFVIGMGSGIIYKYNKNGVFATIPIKTFK